MNNVSRLKTFDLSLGKVMNTVILQRSKVFGFMIVGALFAFEIFNFSTTDFALSDLLGTLTFMGIAWSTILSIAFCGIDFAGVARLLTPEPNSERPAETWYLFGAWVLAAAMNAILTWWGVSIAITNHISQGTSVISSSTIQLVVPIFVAIMVLTIRIMIIGSFSVAGERILGQTDNTVNRVNPQTTQHYPTRREYQPQRSVPAAPQTVSARPGISQTASFRTFSKGEQRTEPKFERGVEPTYHSLGTKKTSDQFEA